MLANTVYQCQMYWLTRRIREQARSHISYAVNSIAGTGLELFGGSFGQVRRQEVAVRVVVSL